MAQVINTLQYDRVSSVTTPTELELELTASAQSILVPTPSVNGRIDLRMTFDPVNVAKVCTFTLTASSPAADDSVTASITVGSVTNFYSVVVQTGDTQLKIQERLTKAIDSDPNVVASLNSATNTITVTSAVPGQDFTLAVNKVGASISHGAVTVATANAGVVNHGLVARVTATPAFVNAVEGGGLDIALLIEWYDGAQPTALKVGQNLYQLNRHPRTISRLQSDRGVA